MARCVIITLFLLSSLFGCCGAYSPRPGSATNTHTCSYVRSVPSDLRSAVNMQPQGLSTFYQKYTEAYGIPVVASSRVSDSALSRACYTLRLLLADNPNIRNNYYKKSGRVGVIGASEQTTDIPEHSWLDSWWNERARGLGATESWPISTGGEENMLCYSNDRYYNEDIFLHEFSHGVHLLGVKEAIPGWDSRLKTAYDQAKSQGLWSNTYAMSTYEEYFSEGTQSYFNVNAYSSTANGVHNSINTREKLRTYDPVLYNLIKEVFPCANTYLKRCESTREQEENQELKMDCDGDTVTPDCKDDNVYCDYWAGNGECSKSAGYMLLYCKLSCNACTTSPCTDNSTNCGFWASIGECTNNPTYMNVNCMKSCGLC